MVNNITGTSQERVKPKARRAFLLDVLSRLIKEKPLGTFGGIIVLILLVTGVFANFIAPYEYDVIDTRNPLAPPSTTHLLGTDNLGRDLFSRIIYGARVSLIVGLAATILSLFISLIIGGLSGYIGGKLDIITQRFVDAFMCFPGLVLLMALMSIFGAGLMQVTLVLGVQFGIGGSRVVRSAVIGIKENTYVSASVAIGSTLSRQFMRHILPNIMAPLIILFTQRVPGVILSEASLSFLGFGVPQPIPSWGGMLSGSGRAYMALAPGLALWPGLALALVIYGVNMFGDALRDLLDPRLRHGIGRYGGTKHKVIQSSTIQSKPTVLKE